MAGYSLEFLGLTVDNKSPEAVVEFLGVEEETGYKGDGTERFPAVGMDPSLSIVLHTL